MENQEAMPLWANSLFTAIQQQTEQQMQAFEQRMMNQTRSTPGTSQTAERVTPVETIEPPTIKRKDRLPNVQEFEGKRSEFRAWRDQINAKLCVDLAHEDQTVRAWYIHSRLRGRALQQITPWLTTAAQQGALNPNDLLYQLQLAYNDSESAERAARKLSILRQGTKPFSAFLAEFERTLLDAGGIDWADQVKKTFLNNTLSKELQTAIIATPIPATYRDYCSMLQTVSYNLESLRGSRYQKSNERDTPAYPAADSTMDWEPTPVSTAITSTVQRRAKWVSQETMDQRKARGVCFRCGGSDHRVNRCKALPAIPPIQAATAIRAEPELEDITNIESGKE